MAWEWVSPVSAAAGASVGAVTTWLAARGGRTHAETVARESARHAEKMAADARQHRRKEEAYVEALRAVARAEHWADRVCPLWDTDSPQPLPELPSEDEQFGVQALLGAYGTVQVRTLFEEFGSVLRSIRMLAETITHSRTRIDVEQEPTYRLRIEAELRPALGAKRRELEKQVAAELRGSFSAS